MQQSKKNILLNGWVFLKVMLAIVAVYFIVTKIRSHESSANYISQLQTAFRQPDSWIFFSIVFLLMFLNWFVEAVKWRNMIRPLENIKLWRSVQAVFSGITISFFTPNRIGEYAGRVFHLEKGKRLRATLITVIENSSQLLVTILTGSSACFIYLNSYVVLDIWLLILLRTTLIILSLVSVILFFNPDLVDRIFSRLSKREYWRNLMHVFSFYSFKDLLIVFLLAIIRFLIFSLQFFILLRIYGCYLQVSSFLLMSCMTFFVITIVPTFTLSEIGVRGAVAAYFFGKITIDVLPVLNAVFSLWLINLAIPALAGAVFIFRFRLENNKR